MYTELSYFIPLGFCVGKMKFLSLFDILIHSATQQCRPVIIIIFAHVSVPPLFKISQNKRRLKIMIAIGRDYGSGRGDH